MAGTPYRASLPQERPPTVGPGRPLQGIHVTRDTQREPLHFAALRHDADELMWARRGRVELGTGAGRPSLHAGHLAWIPAGTVHAATVSAGGDLVCALLDPVLRPAGDRWREPRVLGADPLAGELLLWLHTDRPAADRVAGRTLLGRLLLVAEERGCALQLPLDRRARTVADAIRRNPADRRSVEEWAAHVRTSPRTLNRIFASETGLSLGRWRTRARVDHAVDLLAAGRSVDAVAAGVGYATTSAFIEVFHGIRGETPAVYRRRVGGNRR